MAIGSRFDLVEIWPLLADLSRLAMVDGISKLFKFFSAALVVMGGSLTNPYLASVTT